MKYNFDIDEKSLYKGVTNDYKRGQSPTVHTPLNQAKDKNKWRTKIYDFIRGYGGIDIDNIPDMLKEKCLSKTTSTASGKIVNFFVFSKFALNGETFDVKNEGENYSFAMYVKEETSEIIERRDGSKTRNTHLGRQKLHYPISLSYFSDGYNIDNTKVLDKILEVNGGFAYVVDGFDFDTETKILNFRTTMIGIEGVLLSNVFKRKKGVGVKLLVDGINLDNSSLISPQNNILTKEENDAFVSTLEKIQKSSRSNGLMGEEYVYNNLKEIIGSIPKEQRHISKLYPQSPYDIECKINGETMYIEVKSTKDSKKVLYMSKGERKFMDKYEKHYYLILVTNVRSNHRRHIKYQRKDIMKMETECQSIKFIDNK